MNFSIRKATEGDEDVLREVLIRNGQKPGIVIDDRSLYYLAAEDAVIGLAGAEISGQTALIRSVAVLAPYRGNGIGGELVATLIKELKTRSVVHLYLFSRDSGEYWKRLGFVGCDVREVVGRLPDAPQVSGYMRDGSIWTDVAWRMDIEPLTPAHG